MSARYHTETLVTYFDELLNGKREYDLVPVAYPLKYQQGDEIVLTELVSVFNRTPTGRKMLVTVKNISIVTTDKGDMLRYDYEVTPCETDEGLQMSLDGVVGLYVKPTKHVQIVDNDVVHKYAIKSYPNLFDEVMSHDNVSKSSWYDLTEVAYQQWLEFSEEMRERGIFKKAAV